MSSWIGREDEAFSLRRAVDALLESARQAAPIGPVWIAGVLYPALHLGLPTWSFVPGSGEFLDRAQHGLLSFSDLFQAFGESVGSFATALPFLWILFRLTIGLARIASPEAWRAACEGRRTPRFRRIWDAGKGLTLSCLGLWIQLFIMIWAAAFVFAIPALMLINLDGSDGGSVVLGAMLAGPFVLLLLLYLLVLAVMTQLAMQSLVHNRRGVASALVHAWRILRHDPIAAVRAITVDIMLLAVEGTAGLVGLLLVQVVHASLPTTLLALFVAGYAGVTRAGYWARAYSALGGLAPADGVPGLEDSTA